MIQTFEVNGLPAHLHRVDSDAFAYAVSFKMGPLFEKESYQYGASHFLEHIVFNKTEAFPTFSSFIDFCESAGLNFNAVTFQPFTSFFIDGHKDKAHTALRALEQIICFPIIDEELVNEERLIIHQELKQSQADIDKLVYENILDKYYNEPTYHHTLGTENSIKNMTAKTLNDFRKIFMTKDKMFFGATGNFSESEISLMLEDSALVRMPTNEPQEMYLPNPVEKIDKVPLSITEQLYASWSYTTPASTAENHTLHKFVRALIGGINSSFMTRYFRIENPIAYHAGATTFRVPHHSSILVLVAAVSPEHYLKCVEIYNQIEKDLQNFSNQKMFDSAKNMMRTSLCMKYESTDQRIAQLEENYMTYGKALPYQVLREQLDAITIDDIREYCQKYLRNPKITLIGNLEGIDV